jgi:hypothetical protein
MCTVHVCIFFVACIVCNVCTGTRLHCVFLLYVYIDQSVQCVSVFSGCCAVFSVGAVFAVCAMCCI